MQYRLRTLLLIGAISPIIIAALVWALATPNLSVPRTSSSRKATADIRQLFQSATSLEIVEAGSAIPLRAKSFHGDSLQRLAKAATIYDLDKTNIPSTVVADAYVHFQLMKDGTVLQEYWFRYPDYLVDDSPGHNREGYWTILYMSPDFAREFLREVTKP